MIDTTTLLTTLRDYGRIEIDQAGDGWRRKVLGDSWEDPSKTLEEAIGLALRYLLYHAKQTIDAEEFSAKHPKVKALYDQLDKEPQLKREAFGFDVMEGIEGEARMVYNHGSGRTEQWIPIPHGLGYICLWWEEVEPAPKGEPSHWEIRIPSRPEPYHIPAGQLYGELFKIQSRTLRWAERVMTRPR